MYRFFRATASLFTLLCCVSGAAQQAFARIDTFSVKGSPLYAYFSTGSGQGKKGLLIFLHGSVSAYAGQSGTVLPPVKELLEENPFIEAQCAQAGLDLVLPVVNGSYNWLDPSGELWMKALLDRYASAYDRIYIGGFSDGGTGAYRYFYSMIGSFSGLWILNGYPQLQHFYKKVHYESNRSKPVVVYSQFDDKIVPYEFLLTEFRRQRLINPNAFFRLFPGKHQLGAYTESSISDALQALIHPSTEVNQIAADSIWLYPPLDAFVTDTLVQIQYKFRAKVGKDYGMRKSELQASIVPYDPEKSQIMVFPLYVSLSTLTEKILTFSGTVDGKPFGFQCINYLAVPAW